MPVLNPAQHRILERHVERAVETLREADRLLHGKVAAAIETCIQEVESVMDKIDKEEARMVSFQLEELPASLVPYLENPFAQSLAFNRFCLAQGLSHTRGMKQWEGGTGAVTARNLVFLPPVFETLWDGGELDKTRLVAIANRNLTDAAYLELADMVRTRRREDLDERLLKLPANMLKVGRRGPEQALEAAQQHGWTERFAAVEIAEDLVEEADEDADDEDTPAAQALRALRAGLNGAKVTSDVEAALQRSPEPMVLVERYLTAHRHSGDADPDEVSQTLFFAHAGPMQKLMADDKLLLRHFRPVKTQKRGQLFYRILEAIEEKLQEKSHVTERAARGVDEPEAVEAVRRIILDLNQDPNRFLVIPDEWLGEVTRRHLYFGSRTRKEGAAYKWFRKIGSTFYLGGHKTDDEVAEKQARMAAKSGN